ncbi:hypothetical protein [Mariniflexile sp. AS56]|uniref:hypothetical protein n=1 Tax=Mariniflexile sp. AS56 TaxID=3063957 RepID=UPI0026EC2D94|nr:hypothetical protein [Mariniflexile sp. AS56]MDO7171757.1 hypothetical protein [Mariniflexile sp. AS56]
MIEFGAVSIKLNNNILANRLKGEIDSFENPCSATLTGIYDFNVFRPLLDENIELSGYQDNKPNFRRTVFMKIIRVTPREITFGSAVIKN